MSGSRPDENPDAEERQRHPPVEDHLESYFQELFGNTPASPVHATALDTPGLRSLGQDLGLQAEESLGLCMDSQPLPGSLSHSDPSHPVGSEPVLQPQATPEAYPLVATPISAGLYASLDAGVSAGLRHPSSHATQSAHEIAGARFAQRVHAPFSAAGMQSSGIRSQPGSAMPVYHQPSHVSPNPTWQGQQGHPPHHHDKNSRHIQVARVLQAPDLPHAASFGQSACHPPTQAPPRAPFQAATPIIPVPDHFPAHIAQQLAQGQALYQEGNEQLSQAMAMPPASSLLAASIPGSTFGVPFPSQGPEPTQAPQQMDASSTPTRITHRPSGTVESLRRPSPPESHRASKRRRSDLQLTGGRCQELRSLIPQQELDIAGCLQDLLHPGSLKKQPYEAHPALQGIATARGMQMSAVAELKQHNLQNVRLHPDWSHCYDMGSKSLLDIHSAFAASDLSFQVPLWVNNKRHSVSLETLLQQNLGELYMQAVEGLRDFAHKACADSKSAEAGHFSMGACQSQALMACLLERPSQVVKLVEAHLMKHGSKGQGVSGEDVMRRLEEGLSEAWQWSITTSQRRAARSVLQAHMTFTSQLEDARQKILHEMQQAAQAEASGPQLLPSRVLLLSKHAHSQSVLVALAYEANLQLARKLCLELLSPWQWGMMAACLYPVVPDITFCLKYLAGDQSFSVLPPLADATVVTAFNHLRLMHDEERAAAEASHL